MTEEPPEDLKPESTNDLVFDIKGTAHLSLFYDHGGYQEWRREKKLESGKKRSKRKVVVSDNDEALDNIWTYMKSTGHFVHSHDKIIQIIFSFWRC
jgi:hypothetical protein